MKFFRYILIIFVLLEIFGFGVQANAAGGTCWYNGQVIGGYPNMTREGCASTGSPGCGLIGACHERGTWQDEGTPAPTCRAPKVWENNQCVDAPGPQCSDGRDNDGDRLIDSSDPGCHSDGIVSNMSSYDSEFNSEALRATLPFSPTTKYQFLAPITTSDPNSGTGATFDTDDPNALGRYLNLMIKIFIGLCAVLAVVMIVMGGIEYMTSELVHSKEAGKEMVTNALLGLLIALGAYALLNTINPDLLRTDIEITPTIIVYSEDSVPQTYDPVTKKYPSGILFGDDWSTINKGINGGKPYGVPAFATMNNNGKECVKVGDTGCTSTIGLDTTPLHKIHAQCPTCPLNLTGGSEFWLHGGKTGSTSHKPPNSTIDISVNSALNKYIAGNRPLINNQRYTNGDGLNYLYESNPPHWHIGR